MVTGQHLHSGHAAAISLGESCRRYSVCMYGYKTGLIWFLCNSVFFHGVSWFAMV